MLRRSSRNVIDSFLLRYIRPGSAVLDVGCGYGETALFISRRVPGVTVEAVDIDGPSVERANRRFHRTASHGALRCHKADVRELRRLFGRRRFDYAICNNSFHEFWGPVRTLREIRAVLKSGGLLLLAEYTPCAGERVDDCPRYSREKILELLRRAGFRLVSALARPGVILVRAVKH